MCIAVRIDEETAIFIMPEHPSYEQFLFEQLGKAVELDYELIAKVLTCIENNVFVIYEKK